MTEGQLLSNHIRLRLTIQHWLVLFPAAFGLLFPVALLETWGAGRSIGEYQLEFAIGFSLVFSAVFVGALWYTAYIHSPPIIEVRDGSLVYPAVRWSPFVPRRMIVSLHTDQITQVGANRWFGVSINGRAIMEDEVSVWGFGFRDYIFLSKENLQRLGFKAGLFWSWSRSVAEG